MSLQESKRTKSEYLLLVQGPDTQISLPLSLSLSYLCFNLMFLFLLEIAKPGDEFGLNFLTTVVWDTMCRLWCIDPILLWWFLVYLFVHLPFLLSLNTWCWSEHGDDELKIFRLIRHDRKIIPPTHSECSSSMSPVFNLDWILAFLNLD